jgi:drug/metabolite transporter (DMT)-like permease
MQRSTKTIHSAEFGTLIVLGALWGMPYALTKLSLETIPPITQAAWRVSLAALVLWVIVLIRRCKLPRCSWQLARSFLLQSALACVVPYSLIAFGQQFVDSGLSAILNSTTPLLVCLIGAFWLHTEAVTWRRVGGALIGFGGVCLVVGLGAFEGLGLQSLGQAAIMGATLSSAVSVIYARRFAELPAEIVAAATLTLAAVVLLPCSLLIESPLTSRPSLTSLLALALNGAVATALGFVLYFRLVRTIGSMSTASASYLKPAIGVLLGCALLAEPFTWTMAIGLIGTFLGVAAINEHLSLRPLSNAIGRLARLRHFREQPIGSVKNHSGLYS